MAAASVGGSLLRRHVAKGGAQLRGTTSIARLVGAVQPQRGGWTDRDATAQASRAVCQNLWSTMLTNSVGSTARKGIGPSPGMNSKAL